MQLHRDEQSLLSSWGQSPAVLTQLGSPPYWAWEGTVDPCAELSLSSCSWDKNRERDSSNRLGIQQLSPTDTLIYSIPKQGALLPYLGTTKAPRSLVEKMPSLGGRPNDRVGNRGCHTHLSLRPLHLQCFLSCCSMKPLWESDKCPLGQLHFRRAAKDLNNALHILSKCWITELSCLYLPSSGLQECAKMSFPPAF